MGASSPTAPPVPLPMKNYSQVLTDSQGGKNSHQLQRPSEAHSGTLKLRET